MTIIPKTRGKSGVRWNIIRRTAKRVELETTAVESDTTIGPGDPETGRKELEP
jgi:hypothetical protein